MRLGEIQALQVEDVQPDYINVCHSLCRKYGIKSTKSNISRKVPIPEKFYSLLKPFIKQNKEGYKFSNDKGRTPLYHATITKVLYKALGKIGIDRETRKKRNISFHSFRHRFISKLREANVKDCIIRLVAGHQTEEMTEHYTNKDLLNFDTVRQVQESKSFVA